MTGATGAVMARLTTEECSSIIKFLKNIQYIKIVKILSIVPNSARLCSKFLEVH